MALEVGDSLRVTLVADVEGVRTDVTDHVVVLDGDVELAIDDVTRGVRTG